MDAIDPRVHIDHVVLRVADVPRATAFYGDVLGLQRIREDGDGAALSAPGGDKPLLVLRRSSMQGAAPTGTTGLFHTAIRWPTRAGLGEVLHRVAEARKPLSGASDHGVSEALYLNDPDGNGVELYWDRPRDAWPAAAAGERVAMFTKPLDVNALLALADGTDASGADIGHVHLQVADLDEALTFWSGALGFELMARFGPDAAFVAAGGYHHHIGVNTWNSRGGPPGPPELPGLDTIALAYPDRATLDDAMRRLDGVERVPPGVRITPLLA